MAEDSVVQSSKASGCSPIMFFGILFVIIAFIFGINFGFGSYSANCGDMPLFDCISDIMAEDEEEATNVVTATGPYSYKDYSITMTAQIPLEGGEVTGSVSGDCSGKVTGTYNGENGGSITGKLAGACNVFFVNVPAKATFSGVVNKDSKTVPITFQGSGGGFSHEDSMSLAY